MFETLAYAVGYATFRYAPARQGDVIAEPQRWTVLASAAVGALMGSRILGLAEQWPTVRAAWQSGRLPALLISPGGKTIVGGLLGGWLAVEIAKHHRLRAGNGPARPPIQIAANHSPASRASPLKELLGCLPKVLISKDLGYKNPFRVLIVQFVDAEAFDVRSVKKSCIHIAHPDGKRLIPFDTFNMSLQGRARSDAFGDAARSGVGLGLIRLVILPNHRAAGLLAVVHKNAMAQRVPQPSAD